MTFRAAPDSPSGTSARSRHTRSIALGFYIALSCLYFLPGLTGGRVMAVGDGLMQDLPVRTLLHSMYREGTFPLWNNYVFSGFPLMGSMQAGALYPLNVILYTLFHPYTAFDLSIVLHFAMAGFFAYLYLRLIGLSMTASLAGGALFAFTGFMPSHLHHVPMHEAIAWFPLLLYLAERLLRERSFGGSARLGLALAAQWLCGSPQIAFYSAGLVCFYFLFNIVSAGRKNAARLSSLAAFSFALAFLIALPQIISTMELSSLGTRESLSYRTFSEYSLSLRRLPSLIFPKLFPAGSEAFMGTLPLMLGIASFIALWRENRHVLAWGMVAVVSLLLSLGDSTPLQRLMFHAPGYNLFRAVSRNLFIFNFSFAVLFAIGLDLLFSDENQRSAARAGLGISGAALGLSLAAYLIFRNTAILIPSAFIGLYCLLFFGIGKAGKIPVYCLILLLVIEVLPSVRRDDFPSGKELDSYGAGMFESLKSNKGISRAGLSWGVGNNLWALRHGIEIADGYDPLILSDYSGVLSMNFTGIALWDELLYSNAALSMMNVGYIAVPPKKAGLVESIKDNGGSAIYEKAGDFVDVLLYENLKSLPRAYAVTSLIPAADFEEAAALLRKGGIDPFKSAVVYSEDLARIGAAFFSRGRAEVLSRSAGEVIIETDFPSGGFVVLGDSYYPGWMAHIDGNEIPIYRANAVLRGVTVPSGKRTLVFRYRPVWFYPSIILSAVSLSGALFYALGRKGAS